MDLKNTLAAVSLSAAVIIIYGLFFAEPPKNQEELLKEKDSDLIVNTEAPKIEEEVKTETENKATTEINNLEESSGSTNIEEENNTVDSELSNFSDRSNETVEINSTPSNGLENFDFDEETPELFNSDGSINETEEDNSLTNKGIDNKEEEDELEIPAFLRRQKN